MPTKISLIGRVFGKLTVVARAKSTRFPCGQIQSNYLCRCNSGAEKVIRYSHLKSGLTQSCGCWNREVCASRGTHKQSKRNPLYRVWASMMQRCNNPHSPAFKNYGGRGIVVCERWRDFTAFLKDMGDRPEKMTLERKNYNGNYEPENCIWATRKAQSRNTRANRVVTVLGVTASVAALAEHFEVNYDLVRSRLQHGWNAEQAFFAPLHTRLKSFLGQ